MTKRKFEPLTYEEHTAIGAELKDVRDKLMAIFMRICRGYGTSAKVTKCASHAAAKVDNLRSELDSLLCQSLPAADDSWRGVYYGDSKN